MIYLWSVASDLLVSREGWHGCLDFLKIDVAGEILVNKYCLFENQFNLQLTM